MVGEVSGSELMRAAMANTHGAVVCSGVVAAVIVKLASTLASRPYDDDQLREREVGGGWVVAGHGRA